MVEERGIARKILESGLETIEGNIFAEYAEIVDQANLPLIFVVCSPRVGSTLIYQLLVNKFQCSYISNFVNNYFPNQPVVGIAHQLVNEVSGQVGYYSEYGKTKSIFETSEASAVFANWYGGQHPAEIRSAEFLSTKKREHMVKTLSAIYGIRGEVFVAKNPWNSFRIKSLAETYENAYFVWARRSIDKAAISDLENRYQRGSPTLWNSATTANFEEIQKLPYWEQVVEQQYHFNLVIRGTLKKYAENRSISVWYEDLCANPKKELERIEADLFRLNFPITVNEDVGEGGLTESKGAMGAYIEDYKKIEAYIERNKKKKLSWTIYKN